VKVHSAATPVPATVLELRVKEAQVAKFPRGSSHDYKFPPFGAEVHATVAKEVPAKLHM